MSTSTETQGHGTHAAESEEAVRVPLLDTLVMAAGVAAVAIHDKCNVLGNGARGEDGEENILHALGRGGHEPGEGARDEREHTVRTVGMSFPPH